MMKIYVITVLFSIFCTKTFSQINMTLYGAYAQPRYNVEGDRYFNLNDSPKTKWIGFKISKHLQNKIQFEGDLNYASKSLEIDENSYQGFPVGGYNYNYYYDINSLKLSILTGYVIGEKFGVKFGIGPTVEYKLAADYKAHLVSSGIHEYMDENGDFYYEGYNQDTTITEKNCDHISDFGFGVTTNLNCFYYFNNILGIQMEFGKYFRITDLFDKNNIPHTFKATSNETYISLGVLVKINNRN